LMDATSTGDYFSYTIDPFVDLTAGVLNPDGKSVTLTTSAQAENTLYTVTANGPQDAAGNPLEPGSTGQFRSWTSAGCNGLAFEAYRPLSQTDNNILILKTNASFPNSPSEVLRMTHF